MNEQKFFSSLGRVCVRDVYLSIQQMMFYLRRVKDYATFCLICYTSKVTKNVPSLGL